MSLLVIVNADDFGITHGVNESIVACHRAGTVTSTSFMANMASANHAAGLAASLPGLGVGLHFNLTLGRPVADPARIPSLVDGDGCFMPRGRLIRKAALGQLDAGQIGIELLAQLERMRALGLEPTHFDSHQHVHAIPTVFGVVARQAAGDGKAMRVTWRWKGRVAGKSLARRGSEMALAAMTSRCLALKPAGLRTNSGLCSVFDLPTLPESLGPDSYAALLAPYSEGAVELMVHPGVVDAELATKTAITAVSAAEDRLLRTSVVQDIVAARGGHLGNYSDV